MDIIRYIIAANQFWIPLVLWFERTLIDHNKTWYFYPYLVSQKWWDRSAQYYYVSTCYYNFFWCLFSGICVCLIMRAGHVVEMSTWTKAIIAASAVIIMVHWYCRTTNVYLHFGMYCYNDSDILEKTLFLGIV